MRTQKGPFFLLALVLETNGYELIEAKSDLYKNSFFPKTNAKWNQLEFTAKNLKNFKNHLAQLH